MPAHITEVKIKAFLSTQNISCLHALSRRRLQPPPVLTPSSCIIVMTPAPPNFELYIDRTLIGLPYSSLNKMHDL